jgi:hypothetical protein
MQRLKYVFFFYFLLSNPLIWNLFTFFFLIFFNFCFLQDYDYGQIYVDPTPIGLLQMMF